MIQQTLLILAISVTLFGCDSSKQIKDTVDNGVKDTKIEMNSDIIRANSSFIQSYKKALEKPSDSILSSKINDLYFSITMTSKYIDSLRKEMDKLDDMDLKNIELIKETFINNGIGDSIFNKVKNSYSQTIDIAIADTMKSRLRKTQGTFTEETKKHFFEVNSPLGVNMILYGIESELIKDGTRSLNIYELK